MKTEEKVSMRSITCACDLKWYYLKYPYRGIKINKNAELQFSNSKKNDERG